MSSSNALLNFPQLCPKMLQAVQLFDQVIDTLLVQKTAVRIVLHAFRQYLHELHVSIAVAA